MIFHLALLLQSVQPPPQRPVRVVPDPGVIATDQRVTPAGLQSVFQGRVGGVGSASRRASSGSPCPARHIVSRGATIVSSRVPASTAGPACTESPSILPRAARWCRPSAGSPPTSRSSARRAGRRCRARSRSSSCSCTRATGPRHAPGNAGDSAAVIASSVALGDYLAGRRPSRRGRTRRAAASPSSPFPRTMRWPCWTPRAARSSARYRSACFRGCRDRPGRFDGVRDEFRRPEAGERRACSRTVLRPARGARAHRRARVAALCGCTVSVRRLRASEIRHVRRRTVLGDHDTHG